MKKNNKKTEMNKTSINRKARIGTMLILVAVLSLIPIQVALANTDNSSPNIGNNNIPVCPTEKDGEYRCFSRVIVDQTGSPLQTLNPIGFSPANFLSAYKLSGKTGTIKTIAIIDAFNDPNIYADLTKYSKQFGLPVLPRCGTTTPCFRKVNQRGGTKYPVSDVGWGLEISLDVEIAHAICQNCNILLVEADSNSFNDLAAAFDRAKIMGADVISNSYGANEFLGEKSFDSHYNVKGKAITFSSGDSGYGTSYPAASPYVTAVGGTSLKINPYSEIVWSGAGSGCSKYESKPSFQKDAKCLKRTIADVSADADPATGAAVYDSFGFSGWLQVGGTSLSAPLIAGVYALGGGFSGYGNSIPYARYNPGVNLHDVKSGSNGFCGGTYLCTGKPGYDGPTGLGTPISIGAFH